MKKILALFALIALPVSVALAASQADNLDLNQTTKTQAVEEDSSNSDNILDNLNNGVPGTEPDDQSMPGEEDSQNMPPADSPADLSDKNRVIENESDTEYQEQNDDESEPSQLMNHKR